MLFLLLSNLLRVLLFPGIPEQYEIEKLSDLVNSSYDEINPVLSLDGKTLYFTRVGYPDFDHTLYDMDKDLSKTMNYTKFNEELNDIFHAMGDKKRAEVSESPFNQDIWIATGDGKQYSQLEHPGYPLNSALPNSVCSLTPNSNEIIIINEFYKDGSMYKGFSSVKGNGHNSWDFPRPLFIYDFFSENTGVNLTMNGDGRVIILSLKRPSSKGDNDLYVCKKVMDNLYSSPLPLMGGVNTPFRESTPFITRDGQFLLFSSTRPGGFGGNDLYISKRLDDSWQQWSDPVLLPQPINTASDESQPFINQTTGYMYFTSRRDGSSDIFRVYYHPVAPELREKTLYVHVKNSLTGQPMEASIAMGNLSDGYYYRTLQTDEGTAIFSFVHSPDLIIKGKREGYISKPVELDLDSLFAGEGTAKDITIYLEPKAKEANFTLSNIYFEQSTAVIRDISYEQLDILVSVMRNNQKIRMVISGHTDNVGSPAALQKLSEQRAEAIKQYLVKNNIASDRITTIGMGASKPLNDNATDSDRAKNRRVEISVYTE